MSGETAGVDTLEAVRAHRRLSLYRILFHENEAQAIQSTMVACQNKGVDNCPSLLVELLWTDGMKKSLTERNMQGTVDRVSQKKKKKKNQK